LGSVRFFVVGRARSNMPRLNSICLATIVGLGLVMSREASAADDTPRREQEPSAAPTAEARVERIIATLALDDAAQAARVREVIRGQYRDLEEIHDARDAKIAQAQSPKDAVVAEAWRSVARNEAQFKLYALHRRFLARLEAELTPQQVERVKEAMTGGYLARAEGRYRALEPNLSAQQLADVRADLLEAREFALDAVSEPEQRQWFAHYYSRINARLHAAGYDVAGLEQELSRSDSPAAQSR
jgi:Protein of unknown function (DUF3826)